MTWTVAGWIVVAAFLVLLVFGVWWGVAGFFDARRSQPPRYDETRIGELEARVDNLEAIIVALSRGETTIALSSGGMRDGHKPPPPSPFPIRSIIDFPEDFHD